MAIIKYEIAKKTQLMSLPQISNKHVRFQIENLKNAFVQINSEYSRRNISPI